MDNDQVYTTSLRLYKKRPVHAQAYRCLKNYNTDIFKTKDDFIAEAVIYFSRYLKQEEESKQLRLINENLEKQNQYLVKLVKNAIYQVQNENMPDIIKQAVSEAICENKKQKNLLEESEPLVHKIQESGDWEKDMQFAQFYDLDDED
ncbi:hypothetical protein [Blautia sp.]|uniref:hypothetical protein n=1 Tax=Blautia sp. TaxID=1955243 RepID=UPI002583C044|nr:hypothetical protein [Blautia sp.]